MAFSFDPDGGIAVARILSDHPEDNGKLVYLHVHYTPALDDAWYDQANDPYDAALPISLSRAAPTVPNPGFAQPAGGTTSSNEVKTESRRGQAPGSRGNNALHRRKRPQTTPASNVTETPEAPDTEYPFPAAIQPTTGSGAGGAVLRGGAFGDEAPSSHSSGSSSGSGSGAAGGGRAASEGSGSGSGGNAATAASVGSGMMVPHGILKRKRIHFDPLEPCDEKGEAVPPRRKQRLEGKSEQKYDFPPPPKHPDDMTDAEFDKWTETLTDAEYDEFERYMDDLDAESDAEIDEESEDYDMEDYRITTPVVEYSRAPPVPALPAPKRPKPIIPIATNPNPTAPVGTRANPVSLLGADYFQVGSRERKQIGDKELKQMTAQLAYGPQHQPSYQGPKAEVMKRVHHEAIRDSERRQMGKEIELFGGDCFRLIPSWPKRECIFIVGQQGAGPVSPFDHWDIRFFDHYWHAGKSWFAGRYIREWKKQHPDGRVIVFSQVGEDKELDKCGITRVMIDEGLVDNPYEVKELANCLVVFDDIDAIRDKKIKKVVTDLCDELQVVGRHDNTWVIRTSHLFRNWGTTRASLAEANKTVFFPQLGSSYGETKEHYYQWLHNRLGIRSWLKSHIGLDPKKIERMFKVRSRWVVLDQHAPNWVLSEHLLYIL